MDLTRLLGYFAFLLFLASLVVAATSKVYVNYDFNGNDIFNVTNVNATNLRGNLAWVNLTNYPAACSSGYAISQLNDSVTCTDAWVNVAGDTMTGELRLNNSRVNISSHNIAVALYGLVNDSRPAIEWYSYQNVVLADLQCHLFDSHGNRHNHCKLYTTNTTNGSQLGIPDGKLYGRMEWGFGDTAYVRLRRAYFDAFDGYITDSNSDLTINSTDSILLGSEVHATGNITGDSNHLLNWTTLQQVSDDGLIMYYPFSRANHVNSTLTLDSSPEQNDGTVVNATFKSYRGFDGGSAYEFKGGYITFGATKFDLSNTTFSFWYNLTNPSSPSTHAVFGYSGTKFKQTIQIYQSGTRAYLETDTNGDESISNTWTHTAGWHHIAISCKNYNCFWYRDGKFYGNDSVSDDITLDEIGITNTATASEYEFNGSLDDIRVYNRALSADEIRNLYEQRAVGPDAYVKRSGNSVVYGNITADNLYLPAYLYTHTNATIQAAANKWYNITFDEHPCDLKFGIDHTYNDVTNDTFTITQDGVYHIEYSATFIDTAASPSAEVGIRIIRNGVEINGSGWEKDTTKQNALGTIQHGILARLSSGDKIKMQFRADQNTVYMKDIGTLSDHDTSATIGIHKVAP